MQLFKQLVTRQFQKFTQHDLNKRFFPMEFYSAYLMAAVVLKVERGIQLDIKRLEGIDAIIS